jgi:hypothetical protein
MIARGHSQFDQFAGAKLCALVAVEHDSVCAPLISP